MTLVLGWALGVAVAATVKESGTRYAAQAFEPFLKTGELPGAISVFYKDGVQEVVCVGYADVAKKIPIAMDQLFQQCSQTKGVCGVSIAMLLEDGKIHIDDPISMYLPEFKELRVKIQEGGETTLVPVKSAPTIRMVMNHTAGFPYDTAYKTKHGWTSRSLRDTARDAAAAPLNFEPGTQVQYSNTGMDIGAAIVEVVSGEKWEDFLQRRLFDPLKMSDATFWPTEEQLSRMISFYDYHRGKPAAYRYQYFACMPRPFNGPGVHPSAGAGLWITAKDQLKFYKMLMNLGVSEDGVRILKEETVRNYLCTSTRPPQFDGYSMGLVVDRKSGWFGHGGAWGSVCYMNPEKKLLRLCVVQIYGERFWNDRWSKASEKFFQETVNGAAVDAYTGRMK